MLLFKPGVKESFARGFTFDSASFVEPLLGVRPSCGWRCSFSRWSCCSVAEGDDDDAAVDGSIWEYGGGDDEDSLMADGVDGVSDGVGLVEDVERCCVGVVEEEGDVEEVGVISTSSASRHHLRRRVYLPQPSWRLPFRH